MIELRPYQHDAVAASMQAVERGKNGVIVMPTGSGKSLVIAGVATAADARIIVLQPSKEILEQNARKLYDFGFRDIGIYSASAGQKKRAQVTFATIGSIITKLDQFRETDIIIVDECHLVNANGGEYQQLINHFGKPTIGLTATPYRMKASFQGSVVEAKFLHRTRPRIFDHIGYIVQNADLHEAGYLAPIEYVENEDYDPYAIKLKSTGLNYDEAALVAYNRAKGICQKAADTVVGSLDRVQHFLIFVASVKESETIEGVLSRAGVRTAHIDGKTPKGEREAILSAFQSGEIKVVTNVGVLTTGFDFPALDGVILARPTMSLPLYYQMVGRGVRCAPGKDSCHVFDLCGNVPRFGRPEEYRVDSDDGKKHRLRSGKRYLTGVNFVTGRDLEKDRERRNAKRNKPVAPDEQIPFGKHKGTKIAELPTGYLEWCAENFNAGKWKDAFAAELARRQARVAAE